MQEVENKNYLRHVTDMGEKHSIVASEDIQTSRGIKLIASGTQVNISFYEKLLKHKLLKPIDQSLNIKNCLTPAIIEEKVKKLIKINSLLLSMQKKLTSGEQLHNIFSLLEIPEILLFKLTVAEKQLPVIFNHSLNVAIASVYIGTELN